MFEKYMIVEDNLKNVVDEGKVSGFQFGARLPYYRGVSLSMLEEIEVSVDGKVLPQDKVHLIVHNNTYDLKQREEELDDRWEMGEVATLFVQKEGGLPKGTHQLGLKINIRIGYLPFPAIRNAQKEITIE
ncbi:C-glycoside deglycosidase beta subunit domain-containing protein [Maribacter sp. CXY002]|uniref:C-glycoside deglycosidase beta subunit domain-containing protein n=1 Tax=Maribacter luteocoastalis TaxID=3407671 RepID=UPI003B681F49